MQDRLEAALASIAGHPVRIAGAGRTDSGVHALAQVAHFDSAVVRPESAWVRGVNASLPPEIAVQWALPVDEAFHARFSALRRSYCYVLYNHPVRPAIAARHVGWFHQHLDLEMMCAGASLLKGEHDFSAFRSSECQAKSPVRRMERISLSRAGPYLLLEFTANAFLHHMVRNIVGCLVYVGKGKYPPHWIAQVLERRDRKFAAPTFSGAGLYLTEVSYDARWHLPDFARMMPFSMGTGR